MEVPGARWYRADLHVHTLDDHHGRRIVAPAGVLKGPIDSATLDRYARAFLLAAIARGIEVLALTPHAVRTGEDPASSATWRIVQSWNEGVDDDNVPFRDKIYAVFPGFEPSFTEGKRGVHLIFLFDPEIGPDRFDRAFQIVMQGISPWSGKDLQNSTLGAREAFAVLDDFRRREGPTCDYICLAPHPFSEKGVFNQLKGQVMADFPAVKLAALELQDSWLPEDALKERPWLQEGMTRFRHCFFHGSDGYRLSEDPVAASGELGYRFTMMKLASPTIEAVRQAFLASDSRIRIAFGRGDDGTLKVASDLPDPLGAKQLWLRGVSVKGGKSFFRGEDPTQGVSFRFSPGLTCIVGGRMSGKSTLLDGIRVHRGLQLPREEHTRSAVESRGRGVFLAGDPSIELDFGGLSAGDGHWPGQFFTQRELQDAVRDHEGFRHLLFNLVPGRAATLGKQDERLQVLDSELSSLAANIAEIRAALAEAEQSFQMVTEAKAALDRYEEVGAARLKAVQSDRGKLEGHKSILVGACERGSEVLADLQANKLPAEFSPEVLESLGAEPLDRIRGSQDKAILGLEQACTAVGDGISRLAATLDGVKKIEEGLSADITRALVAAGGTPEDLVAFDKHRRVAAGYEQARLDYERCNASLNDAVGRFDDLERERTELVVAHRHAVTELASEINNIFDGRIRIYVEEEGLTDPLETWLRGLHQRGVTRWWNDRVESGAVPRGTEVFSAMCVDKLGELGMSQAVVASFKEAVTDDKVYELRALRCPDRYRLEFRVSDDPVVYRELGRLSGGLQASVILTLLLESNDPRPLIIDQPEDELDNAYLFEIVLPAFHRLKGRRQVIFATHNPNIVVNGDADQVIALEADHERGRVRVAGAIEHTEVRRAIIDTVDGGREAFQLRFKKYGF